MIFSPNTPIRTLLILFFLFYAEKSQSFAQSSNNLKRCSEALSKNRSTIMESKLPNTQFLFPTLDPTYQKIKQINMDWAECVKGYKAPLASFKTLDGESYSPVSLKGKVVVVNFWFMSCAPCRAEMPALNRLVEEYKGKDVIFLGFSSDRTDQIKPDFFKKNRFDFKIVPHAQSLADSFAIAGYPTTYIIDQEGIIRKAWIGLDNSIDSLEPYNKAKEAIDKLLVNTDK